MAEVLDEGKFWKLVMDTTATPVETINEPARGFKAVIGESPETGKHVVMNVLYDKSMSTLDDVVKRVEQLRTCGRCQTLDKEKMKINKIQVQSSGDTIVGSARLADTPSPGAVDIPLPNSLKKKTGVKDMFADTFFDAFLTRPGKYFIAIMTGDDDLLESVMPKSDDEMVAFMDEMIEFMSGNMDFARSPEEAREFLSVVKASHETDGSTAARAVLKKKARKELPMMTVY